MGCGRVGEYRRERLSVCESGDVSVGVVWGAEGEGKGAVVCLEEGWGEEGGVSIGTTCMYTEGLM